MDSGSSRKPCTSFKSNKMDIFMDMESDESLLLCSTAEEAECLGVGEAGW